MSKKELPKNLISPIKVEPILLTLMTAGSASSFEEEYEGERLKLYEYVQNEKIKKLHELAEFFKLNLNDPGDHLKLISAMADHFVLGFQVKERISRGPRKKWDGLVLYRLWYEVKKKMMEKNVSALSACGILHKATPWKDYLKSKADHKTRTESLYKEYERSRTSPYVKFVNNIMASHPKNKKLSFVLPGMYEIAIEHMDEKS